MKIENGLDQSKRSTGVWNCLVIAASFALALPTALVQASPHGPPAVFDSQGYEIQDPTVLAEIRRHSDHIQSLLQRSEECIKAHHWKEALEAYAEIAKTNPASVPFDKVASIYVVLGKKQEAVEAFRQVVYRAGSGSDGQPVQEWIDEQGRKLSKIVSGTYKVEWNSAGNNPGILARYAIMLSDTGRYAEALQVHQWAMKGLRVDGEEKYPGMGTMLDLKGMTSASFDKRRFDAICYVTLALDGSGSIDSSGLWITDAGDVVERANVSVVAARKAVATRGDFAPAYLILGDALDRRNKPGDYGEARTAWKKAVANARNDAQRELAEKRLH